MYTEQSFTTDNVDLVAILLTFGAALCSHMPMEWVDIYPNVEAYLDALHGRIPKAEPFITFNVDVGSTNIKAILEAANATKNEDKFTDLVKSSGLDPDLVLKLLKLHSFAVASACREVLEWREWLEEQKKTLIPNRAKWVQVRGPGAGQCARFGYGTSAEKRFELLEDIQ
jgi:hypothetical protein